VAVLGAGAFGLVRRSPLLASLPEAKVDPMTLQRLGSFLFREHLLAFEIAGLLLLAAMIAAVSLVKREL